MLRLFIRIWKHLFKKETYKIRKIDDLPDILDDQTIYLVEDWAISFVCPCGCREVIHLNAIESVFPRWTHTIGDSKRIDIYPSIHRTVGCKSHFWVKNGKINWCKDSPNKVMKATYYSSYK
ncbi:hypothetical protein JMN32_08795 [Fulvivirga sp. 29W222]|uniref:Uncharacterized protein n=1 Tax=Fulvivirga marina TaxID=2494733 RepID=A0A937KDN1_9BACT|nr:DUF6527 family protein [Fulvivirga marina]MBL6446403.1 hypothetical protein [Fulvivirga marina]